MGIRTVHIMAGSANRRAIPQRTSLRTRFGVFDRQLSHSARVLPLPQQTTLPLGPPGGRSQGPRRNFHPLARQSQFLERPGLPYARMVPRARRFVFVLPANGRLVARRGPPPRSPMRIGASWSRKIARKIRAFPRFKYRTCCSDPLDSGDGASHRPHTFRNCGVRRALDGEMAPDSNRIWYCSARSDIAVTEDGSLAASSYSTFSLANRSSECAESECISQAESSTVAQNTTRAPETPPNSGGVLVLAKFKKWLLP
jgi:hypothetical protein